MIRQILEEILSLDDALDKTLEPWRKRGFVIHVKESPDSIYVQTVVVPSHKREQGHGTKIMKAIMDHADKVQKPISLTPAMGLGSTSEERLTGFYSDLGFKKSGGKSDPAYKYSGGDSMVRMPARKV